MGHSNCENMENDDFPKTLRRRGRARMRERGAPSLNIVSLIDVFAVLVFFLLSGASVSAAKLQSMQLRMAEPSAEVSEVLKERTLNIRLTKLGVYVSHGDAHADFPVHDLQYDFNAITDFLQEVKQSQPSLLAATLEVADEVNYADIVALMSVLNRWVDKQGHERVLFPNISLANISVSEVEGHYHAK